MIETKYIYLIGASSFILPWLWIFIRRADLRQEMLSISLIGAFIGPFFQHVWYTVDWWNPVTVTGTRVGVEDAILGFTNIGIAVAIYEMTFHKSLSKMKKLNIDKAFILRFLSVVTITMLPLVLITNVAGYPSFYGNVIGLIIGGLFVLWKRRDLLHESLWTSLLLTLLTFPVYWFLLLLAPTWFDQHWQTFIFTQFKVLWIPIGDIIWYAASGFFMGGLYEYLTGQRIISQKRK